MHMHESDHSRARALLACHPSHPHQKLCAQLTKQTAKANTASACAAGRGGEDLAMVARLSAKPRRKCALLLRAHR
jgi:hypothetical protein